MKHYGLNELREMFLSFFESKGHLRLPSFSLLPQNDPSLLLINSGMAPMKPWFTGEQEPPRARVCTCQKCIRTGDIDNIGYTDRHGTYFEMLGNFSFGDYFKKEAIAWCWEFLTSPDWVGLDCDRLYPSVYLDDDEAWEIWNKDIGIPAKNIFRFGKADNFWEHGSGPCGPCSEVYFDRGEKYGCGKADCTVGCDCDRYIEVWNNVFSQFNSDGNNHYTELEHKNIDTGMGLERLACVCQDVASLFDVDTVMKITNKVSEITGATYGQSRKTDISLRVITDHIRSATFMIGDGVLPSNEGRGYVLRRLLRRAARHGKLHGVNEPFLYIVCSTVISENSEHYGYLCEKEDFITRVIRIEEENFARTIDGGMKIVSDRIAEHKARGESVFTGADAFKLYDTYGFPIDLTEEIIIEAGLTLDRNGFNALMTEQKERARAARAAMGDLAWAGIDLGLDNAPTVFTGYDKTADQGRILAIVADDEIRTGIMAGQDAIIVLDKTPFYAEMGGQSADFGTITGENGVFRVTGVQKNKGGKFLHHGKMALGELIGDTVVTAQIDTARRNAIMRAHSATHLLQKALVEVLGEHIHQAGSLVSPDVLRFDFTHFAAITSQELSDIGARVNGMILDGLPVSICEMSIEEAKKTGATALFGEKYGDAVRVVSMGDYSKELCGGTHVTDTARIGALRIESESSIASGVRRIEATVGKETLRLFEDRVSLIQSVSETFKTNPTELLLKANQMVGDLRDAKKKLDALQGKLLRSDAESLFLTAKQVGTLRVVTTILPDMSPDQLRFVGDYLRDKDETIVAVLATTTEEKISFLAVCGKSAISAGIKAGEIIKTVTAITGGSGGGKPDSAMGGGKDMLKLDEALSGVSDFVAEKLK